MTKQLIYILLLSVTCMLAACHESPSLFTDDTTEEYQLYDYYIDQYGNEGIVAFIDSSKSFAYKVIIVISVDEANLPWGSLNERVYLRDSIDRNRLEAPTYGVAMLQTMCSRGIDKYPAQAWCHNKNNDEPYPRGGSWRLPTYYEYRQIFDEKHNEDHINALNKALTNVGGTPLSDAPYWTCTEDVKNYIVFKDNETDYDQASRAVVIFPSLTTYSNKDKWLKKNYYNVRAIKYVYYHYY